MLNIVTELLEGEWELNISKAFLSKPSGATRVKFWELVSNMKTSCNPSTLKKSNR